MGNESSCDALWALASYGMLCGNFARGIVLLELDDRQTT